MFNPDRKHRALGQKDLDQLERRDMLKFFNHIVRLPKDVDQWQYNKDFLSGEREDVPIGVFTKRIPDQNHGSVTNIQITLCPRTREIAWKKVILSEGSTDQKLWHDQDILQFHAVITETGIQFERNNRVKMAALEWQSGDLTNPTDELNPGLDTSNHYGFIVQKASQEGQTLFTGKKRWNIEYYARSQGEEITDMGRLATLFKRDLGINIMDKKLGDHTVQHVLQDIPSLQ